MTQDRTRAIVEAAESLVGSFSSLMDEDPRMTPDNADMAFDIVRQRVDDLAESLSIPSPQWTRTPPSEPGLYYLRGPGDAFNGAAGEIRTSVAEVRMLGHRDVLGVWLLPSQCRDEAFLALDRMPDGFEWWPVRIEEPPA